MNVPHQISRAQDLVAGLDLDERHAIIIEHNDDVTALAAAALIAGQNGQVENVRLLCETLFALGYKAGKDDRLDLGVFKDGEAAPAAT